MAPLRRDEVRRWAAPVGFLAALTIAVVLIHNGLSGGGTTPTVSSPATTVFRTAPKSPHRRTATGRTSTAGAQYYVVQSGDTFGSIAAKYGTTVAQIEALNPGVSSNSLTVGQRIRVK